MPSVAVRATPRPPHEADDKKLVRASSLERIRRFNSFICSQQYYVLPGLLAWLRSSQAVAHAERTIFVFRSLIFTHFLYRPELRPLAADFFHRRIRARCARLVGPRDLLRGAVYLTASVLLTELGLCFYFLCETYVPSGLVFLIVCLFYIIYLNVRSVYFSFRRKELTKKRN